MLLSNHSSTQQYKYGKEEQNTVKIKENHVLGICQTNYQYKR